MTRPGPSPPTPALPAPPGPVAVIVFAKAPVPGQVKTRLAPALGDEGAAHLAGRLIGRALAAATAARLGPVELCAAPGPWHPALVPWHGQATHHAAQGDGDLGARMARALQRWLDAGLPALLMGTDAPAIDAPLLRQAAALLHTHPAVFAPALDGGYALVGLRAPVPTLFGRMAWSTPGVMAESRRRLAAAGLRWAELPPVADIDTPADLMHARPWLDDAVGH